MPVTPGMISVASPRRPGCHEGDARVCGTVTCFCGDALSHHWPLGLQVVCACPVASPVLETLGQARLSGVDGPAQHTNLEQGPWTGPQNPGPEWTGKSHDGRFRVEGKREPCAQGWGRDWPGHQVGRSSSVWHCSGVSLAPRVGELVLRVSDRGEGAGEAEGPVRNRLHRALTSLH